MLKITFIVGILFGGMTVVIGQRLPELPTSPVTPQASAIFKSIAAPVSYYTGQPDVSIPIYTISQDGVDVPISISFNTSGILVNEEATSIGLGVSLNWGGSIVRSPNGQVDERGFFTEDYKMTGLTQELPKDYSNVSTAIYYPYNNFPQSFTTATAREHEYSGINSYDDPYADGNGNSVSRDLRPDDFHYNVLGKSGLFKFNQFDRKFVTFPLDDIRINKTSTFGHIQNFEITKNDGTKIILGDGAVESSTKYNTSVHTNYNQIVEQSWYIKKITTIKNSTIEFSYLNNTYDNTSESRSITYVPEKPYSTFDEHFIPGETFSTSEKLIKTINFKAGRLEFVYINDRTDFPSSQIVGGPQPAPRLDQIILFDLNNNKIKTFQFIQSYYHYSPTPSLDDRLKLDALSIKDNAGVEIEKYQFEYNTATTIPGKKSGQKDWWGYYNGTSGNRYINTATDQIFTIKKITFPTGGYRTYTFENNVVPWDDQYMAQLRDISNEWYDSYSSNHLVVNGASLYDPYGSSNQTSSGAFILSGTPPYDNIRTVYGDEFTIQGASNVNAQNINFSGNTTFIHPEITISQLNLWAYNIQIGVQQKVGTTFTDFTWTTFDRLQTSPVLLPTNTFDINFNNLANGTYRLFVRTTSPPNLTGTYSQHTDAVLTYRKANFNNFKVGGLRVKEITDHENTNSYTTSYEYAGLNNYGSGHLVTPPEYKEFVHQNIIVPGGPVVNGVPQSIPYSGYRISSDPVFPLQKTQGSNVGYTTVIKKQTSANEEIKEEFTYSFVPSVRSGYLREYFKESEPRPWQSGKLLSNKKYKDGLVSSEEVFDYYGLANETDKGYTDEIITNLTGAGNSFYDIVTDRRVDNPIMIGNPPQKVFTYLYAVDNALFYYDGVFTRLFQPPVKIPYFKSYTGFDALKSKTTKYYSNQSVITQSENYFYDALPLNLNLTRTETTNSKNEVLASKYYYPQDLSSDPYMSQLIAGFRIGSPIKIEQYRNTIKINEQKAIYELDPVCNVVLPKANYSATFPNDNPDITNPPVGKLIKKMSFNKYDAAGNLIEYQGEDGVTVSLIWGYNNLYPVAKVVGSDYQTAISFVNTTILNSPPNDASLLVETNKIRTGLASVRAMVTTYTYAPLVGITTQVDQNNKKVTYEYDNFNRLKLIRDNDNKILKSYDYQYHN